MKHFMMMVCGAAMISLATLAQAQDSTSLDYNDQNTLEQSQDQQDTQKDQAAPTQEDPAIQTSPTQPTEQPIQDGNNAIRQGQSRESEQPTREQTDQTMERPNEIVPVEGKEGPNGEIIFMENGKYYYMNEGGDKKEIDESDLREKSQ